MIQIDPHEYATITITEPELALPDNDLQRMKDEGWEVVPEPPEGTWRVRRLRAEEPSDESDANESRVSRKFVARAFEYAKKIALIRRVCERTIEGDVYNDGCKAMAEEVLECLRSTERQEPKGEGEAEL